MAAAKSTKASAQATNEAELDGELDGEGGEGEQEQEVDVPSEPAQILSREDKKALFERYTEQSDLLTEARAAVEEQRIAVSDIVQEIAIKCGKGPFVWNGQKLAVSKRGEVFYMKSFNVEAEEI